MVCVKKLILAGISFLSLMLFETQAKVTNSDSKVKLERAGKFIFNIVRFRNDPCIISETEIGVCYTSDECTNRGGQARSSCAAGFGTCCLFKNSCYGNIDAPLAYFTNPSYPETDWVPNYCTYTVKISDPDVCQLRLDFEDFLISGPSLLSSPFGKCSNDRFAIFSSQQQELGLSEGNLICGDMTSQHIYIPVNATQGEDIVRLFAMVGTGFGNVASDTINGLIANYTWNVKVTQIDCSEENPLQAPMGCLQYFTEISGSIESFNFRMTGSPYPVSMNYAICIKRTNGFCGINLNAMTSGDAFKLNTNGNPLTASYGRFCYDFSGFNSPNISADYISVLGGYTFAGTAPVEAAQHCGIYDGLDRMFPGVTTFYPGPIVVNVRSDEAIKGPQTTGPPETPEEAINLVNSGVENGFRLSYSFKSTCNALP